MLFLAVHHPRIRTMAIPFSRTAFSPDIRRAMLMLATVIFASATLPAATVNWNTDSSGSWSTAVDWTSNPNLPGTADDVVIDRPTAAVTITHSGASDSINNLTCNETLVLSSGALDVVKVMRINGGCTLSGGTLGGGGTVQVAGTMNWNGGTIESVGGVSVASGGNLAIGGSSGLYLYGTSLSNAGTITQSGIDNFFSQGSNAAINNLSGGVFDCQSDSSIASASGSGQTFYNAGTFRKSAGTGLSLVAWTFNNSGTVDVQIGAVKFTAGGTHDGTFRVAAGTKLEFSGGANYFAGAVFSNSGTTLFSGGTAYFNTPTTIPGTVAITKQATLDGTSAATFENLTWSGGTLAGSTAIAVGGNLAIRDGGLARYFNGGALSNAGTVVWSGSNDLAAQGYNARIDNLSAGVIDCQGDASLLVYSGANHALNNAGIFRKSISNGGATVIAWAFNNSGEVKVDAGTLRLTGGGTYGGTFEIAPNATLELKSGDHVLAGAAFVNAGQLLFDGGTFVANAPITIAGAGTTVVSGTGVALTAKSIVQATLTIGTTPAAVPEPAAWTLLLSAGLLVGCRRFRRR